MNREWISVAAVIMLVLALVAVTVVLGSTSSATIGVGRMFGWAFSIMAAIALIISYLAPRIRPR